MVRRTEIRISPRISGRLGEIKGVPGARVAKGAVVAVLDAPDLIASLGQANAAAANAAADRANTYAGVRKEEQNIAREAVETARRQCRLRRRRAQSRDGARGQGLRLARAGRPGDGQSRFDQRDPGDQESRLRRGDRRDRPRRSAASPTRVSLDARATRGGDRGAGQEITLTAPVDGVVKTVVGELGEIVRPGQTVVTIVPSERAVVHLHDTRGQTCGQSRSARR